MILFLLLRFAANVAALWVAAELLDGVSYDDDAGVLLLAAAVLTLANFAVKPIITIIAIPLIILTLGVALFFVNLLMLLLTSWLVGDFDIEGFWTADGATLIVWAVNAVLWAAVSDRRRRSERG